MKIKNLFIILSLFKALICGVSPSNVVNTHVTGMDMEFVPVSKDEQAIGVVDSASNADVNVSNSMYSGLQNCWIALGNLIDADIYAEGNAGTHQWSLVTGMELQDNYAYVAGNVITVKNKQVDYAGSNAYGISFSQYGNAAPVFNITNNCVKVINGEYAVYVQYSAQTTYVTNNCLNTTCYSGNVAVYPVTNVVISGNYCCSNCTNCTNCPVHP